LVVFRKKSLKMAKKNPAAIPGKVRFTQGKNYKIAFVILCLFTEWPYSRSIASVWRFVL